MHLISKLPFHAAFFAELEPLLQAELFPRPVTFLHGGSSLLTPHVICLSPAFYPPKILLPIPFTLAYLAAFQPLLYQMPY